MNKTIIKKRLGAYIIDAIIVEILIYALISTPLNPNKETLEKDYSDLSKISEQLILDEDTINKVWEDKKISEEELGKLSEIRYLKDEIKNIDGKSDKEIYESISEKFYEHNLKETKKCSYNISKHSIPSDIISLSVMMLYYVMFVWITHGQTFGKRIFKLQIRSKQDSNLNILNYLVRSLILNGTIISILNLIIILMASKNFYFSANTILYIASLILEFAVVFKLFTSEDSRGLHDILAGTKVVDLKEEGEI